MLHSALPIVGLAGFCCLILGDELRADPSPPDSTRSGRVVEHHGADSLRAYQAVCAGIEAERQSLAERWRLADSADDQRVVIDEARHLITRAVTRKLAPHWYGTTWDFYGVTQTPGEGAIACGYFISTVLRDAGFRVERVRMAQQASLLIIKSLTSAPHIKHFSDVPIERFVDSVQGLGDGLYVVGLDIHVGFISVEEGEAFFIHSAYVHPNCVLRESADESPILTGSRYRVIGKISADDDLIRKWLEGEHIVTRLH